MSYRPFDWSGDFFSLVEKLSYEPFDWLILCSTLARGACAPTAGVKFVNMAAYWCTAFKVFELLLLSFLHKILQKILKSFKSAQARYER